MELKIGSEERVKGEIDLIRFERVMKQSKLDIERAIKESTIITKNELEWSVEYILRVLLAEIDWTAILMNLKRKNALKMFFRICPITFREKIEYEKYAKTEDYSEVVLEKVIKNGHGNIVINSFNHNPEHNIDVWIAKSIFPYTEGEWKEILPAKEMNKEE